MPDPQPPTEAALSTMASQIDDLIERARAGGAATDREPTEAVAAALFDAERALRNARRAVARASSRLA